jgi:O-antigen/teichoic acid export membrane protein
MALRWINFQDFIFLYIGSNGLISLLMLISIMASGQFSWHVTGVSFDTIEKNAIIKFGLFTVISTSIYVLLQKVDTLMLSAMAGDNVQGVYSWYFNIAVVIGVPAQALSRTTYPIVSNAWKTKDMKSIDDVYSKTSIIQMVVGCLLFIGVIVNRQNLYAIAHNKEFTDPKYFSLFIVVGLGFLVDITGGLNAYIVTSSHKYKLFLLFVVISVGICVLMNYLLIPRYRGLGSAIAYLFTLTLLNFTTWLYIKYRFKLQPFRLKHIWVVIITAVSFAAGYYCWRMPNVPADIVVRSGITTLIYGSLIYIFHISPDINEKVDQMLVKFKIKQ